MALDTKEQFYAHMGSITNFTMIGHGLKLGKELGLLSIMMELTEPKTSEEIAKKGNFKERYVREWLNLMVCGKVVDYDKPTKKYFIPEHKKEVIGQAGRENHLHMFGTVVSFVVVQPHLKECFKLDGPRGIPMSTYDGFQFHHHSHESHTIGIDKMKEVLENIPGLISKLDSGCKVFEAGCSSGILSRKMAEAFPKSTVFGVDISDEGIQRARSNTQENMKNVTYDVADLSSMPQEWSGMYDFAYSHFVIHDVPKASVALKEIWRILKPGGVYLMIDFNMHSDVADNINHPKAALTYAACLYFAMPLSLSEEGGEGLGPTWGIENMEEYMKNAGFVKVFQPKEPSKDNAYVAGFKPN